MLITGTILFIPDISVTANTIPFADAGSDQSISEGDNASFNVSDSNDPDGYIARYKYDFGDGTNFTWEPTIQFINGTNILVYVTLAHGTYNRTCFDYDIPRILEEEGFTVTISGTDQISEINSSILANYDQLWIISTNYSSTGVFSPSEIGDILSFQENGGGILIMADHTFMGASAATDANQISINFNVTFSGRANHGHQAIYPFIVTHPLCENVGSIWGHDSEALITETNPDVDIIGVHSGYNMIAVLDNPEEGRIVFDTSFTRVEDGGDSNGHDILNADNIQYAKNIAKWLGERYISEMPPIVYHTYGDNGMYTMTLIVTDNEGANATDTAIVTVNNVAPIIVPFGPFVIEEGSPLSISTNATDSGSDDLNFTLNWGDGTSDMVNIYYNDGIGPDPYPSPFGTFPFSMIDRVQHIYESSGVYILNLTVRDDDGGITLFSTNVTVITISPPTLYINTSQDGKDVIIYWEHPSPIGIDYYLLYRSTSQVEFNFNTGWVNTTLDNETGEVGPIPLRTIWNDTNAALPHDDNYEEQYYYVIRMVNIFGSISRTSRTVGKWTKTFSQGISTFSLPLEPVETMVKNADFYVADMNARYIKWMDPITHVWIKHGEGEVNDAQLEVGRGYVASFDSETNYTFCGMPAAMISYDDDSGFLGFDHLTEAESLNLFVDPDGDVILVWEEPGSMSDGWYEVYYSNTRDGFFGELNTTYFMVDSPLDYGINSTFHSGACADDPGASLYYMVVPFNESGIRGASTYSIGIWTEEYWEGYDTIGIPLKLNYNQCADWFCDNIAYSKGINFYNVTFQEWWWHSTVMPKEAFDPILKMTEGYQISTTDVTSFTFIGI